MRLNLGCGSQVPEGWTNVDYALGARLFKIPFFYLINKYIKLFDLSWNDKIYIHDLRKKFPWDDDCVSTIYSSHTLEHFTRQDGRMFLSECYRVLSNNGIIRIVVPDLKYDITEYIEGRTRSEDFLDKLGVLYGNNNNALKNYLSPFIQFPHKCMYDSERLLLILKEIGFDASYRTPFESKISDIRLIELENRTKNAVIVEGIKQ